MISFSAAPISVPLTCIVGYGLDSHVTSHGGWHMRAAFLGTHRLILVLPINSFNRSGWYRICLFLPPLIHQFAYRMDFIPAKLIVESPWTSVQNVVQNSTLLNIDSDFVNSLKFENAENVKDVAMLLMWIHGVEDINREFQMVDWFTEIT